MYEFFVENDTLPVEQKGCRRESRGTKDQLLIDKTVFADCKRKYKNLALAWMDYGVDGTGNNFSAEIHGKLEDRTDILWRDTWFS